MNNSIEIPTKRLNVKNEKNQSKWTNVLDLSFNIQLDIRKEITCIKEKEIS